MSHAVSNNDEDLARMKQSAERREEERRRRIREEKAKAPPPPTHPIDSGAAVEVGCQVVGGILRCLTGAAFGQGGTRGRKTRGRKRKNTKNTRYQKRAR